MHLFRKTYNHPTSTEWVTFVHGAGGSSNVWFKQLKAFREKFNVLLIDLRGHGKSLENFETIDTYQFDDVVNDIVLVQNELGIEQSHFVGISLGSILIKRLAILHPNRVKSMVLGGIILRVSLQSSILLFFGNLTKRIVPYIWLYKLFAGIILPRKNHAESRKLFIREAKRLNQNEFLKWFAMTRQLRALLKNVRAAKVNVPTIYIQGEEDHMFVEDLKRFIQTRKNQILRIIEDCGHVVNVEKEDIFNRYSIDFIEQNS